MWRSACSRTTLWPLPVRKRGGPNNPNREIDLAEISRWGRAPGAACNQSGSNGNFDNTILCKGDAQFALQLVPIGGDPMVNRYCVSGDLPDCTAPQSCDHACHEVAWRAQAGHLRRVYGGYTFAQLNSEHPAPNKTWKTEDSLNPFVPDTACDRFHINLWFGNYPAGNSKRVILKLKIILRQAVRRR